jgi:hypothetical protein
MRGGRFDCALRAALVDEQRKGRDHESVHCIPRGERLRETAAPAAGTAAPAAPAAGTMAPSVQ